MKRILIALVVGLLLFEAGRRLYRPPDEATQAGLAAYQGGDYDRAEARFRQAEAGASDPARAAHNHAAALYRLGHYEEADRAYERSADGGASHDARAAYDRGNSTLSQASPGGTPDQALVARAVEQYERCLAREAETSDAGSLFADARHNLELAKLLLADQQSPDAAAATDPDNPNGLAVARNDDPSAPTNLAQQPEQECPL